MPTASTELERVLIRRDGLTPIEARELINEASLDLTTRLEAGEFVDEVEFMSEWFFLEPDYLLDLNI